MHSLLPRWMGQVPEPIAFGALMFVAMVLAFAMAVPVVWFNNWRRLVPEPFDIRDYLKASLFSLLLSLVASVGAGIGVTLLSPLRRLGPGIAAIPGGVLILLIAVQVARRKNRRDG